MKMTLSRQIQLDVAEMFLSLERDIIRLDIKEYLSGNEYEDQMLNEGVKNYLKKVGIYDKNLDLTKYGSSVKETGIFKVREKGKYKIWIDNKKVIFLQRVSSNWDKVDDWKDLDKTGYSIPINTEDFYRFELKDLKNFYAKQFNEKKIITETIQINENSSSTVFSGELWKELSASNKPIPENVEFKDWSIWDIIEKIFPDDWNKGYKRRKIQLKQLDNNEIENFEKDFSGDYLLFNYKIDKLPIEPYDKTEAMKWRNKLLNKEIAQNYLTEKNFDGLVSSINEKEGFSSYKDTMDKPEIKNYLKNEIEPNSLEFWHLYAPMDLNPDLAGREVKNA